nr:MAG TPA: hypothetical protein [Caudoviricetes sp.]
MKIIFLMIIHFPLPFFERIRLREQPFSSTY